MRRFSQRHTTEYIAGQAAGMQRMAEEAGLPTLAYLLSMTHLEASILSKPRPEQKKMRQGLKVRHEVPENLMAFTP
jgi:hypothetical protein